jgi:peptidoglycan lytic transglycosylase
LRLNFTTVCRRDCYHRDKSVHTRRRDVYNNRRGGEVVVRSVPRTRTFALALLAGAIAACSSSNPARIPQPRPVAPHTSVLGTASWYGPGFDGHRTSSGEVYDQEQMTAASLLFPLGTELLVTDLANGRAVEVRVNDHGPYVKNRGIDLSRAAARTLEMIGPGTAPVRMDVIGTPAGGPVLGQRYYVQVGAFTDPANAERIARRFARLYADVDLTQERAGRARIYRVRMGSFNRREQAQFRAAALARSGYNSMIIAE